MGMRVRMSALLKLRLGILEMVPGGVELMGEIRGKVRAFEFLRDLRPVLITNAAKDTDREGNSGNGHSGQNALNDLGRVQFAVSDAGSGLV